MNQRSKKKLAFMSASASGSMSIFNYILKFFLRGLFLSYLTLHYVGLVSVMYSIIGTISIINLGIPEALNYMMFKPTETKNWGLVRTINDFYIKVYRIFAMCNVIVSVALIPFLPFILKDDFYTPHLHLIYGLFVFDVLGNYLLMGKKPVLNADQRQYLFTINQFGFYLLSTFFQVFVLVFPPFDISEKFILYLLSIFIPNFFFRIRMWFVGRKLYGFIDSYEKVPIPKEMIAHGKKQVIGIFVGQLAGQLAFGLDNILLTMYTGLGEVGKYANYALISQSISALYFQIVNAVFPGVGKMVATSNNQKIYQVFRNYRFMTSCLAVLCINGLSVGLGPLVKVWLGEQYVYGDYVTYLIAYLLGAMMMMNSIHIFITGSGMQFTMMKWNIIGALINFGSALFCFQFLHLGVISILISTIFADIVFGYWIGAWELFRKIEVKYSEFVKDFAIFFSLMIGSCLVTSLLSRSIPENINGFILLFSKCSIALAVSILTIVLFLRKTDEYKFALNMANKAWRMVARKFSSK